MNRREVLAGLALAVGALRTPARAQAVLQQGTGAGGRAGRPLAIGLAGVNDWSVQQPFIDVMKTARPWIGHRPGRWGGASHDDLEQAGYLDENGWPLAIPPELSSIGTVVLTDLPEEAVSSAGRYRLAFRGDGIVEVGGRARRVRYGKGEVRFDFTPGRGPVDIRIQRTDRRGTGDHVRDITIVREDQIPAFEAGAVFNPAWLDRLQGFAVLRFMDWMRTNDSPQSAWADRPRPGDYTYARRGVPAEVMIELANRTGADPWFNMPHLADDDYVRRFAAMVRDRLWREQKAYVEFSNEVWNWQFEQARWAGRQAEARWGSRDGWVQAYAVRAAEIAQIWSAAFPGAERARLVNVISTQTGWVGLERDILDAPLWMAEDGTGRRQPPHVHFDAYAVTGYFGYGLGREENAPMVREWIAESARLAEAEADRRGLSGAARDAWLDRHRLDAAFAQAAAEIRDGQSSGETKNSMRDLLGRILPLHADVAKTYGLDLIMYEGGSHVAGIGPVVDDDELTAFFTRFNYTPEMGALYTEMIEGWHALGGRLFNAYADVYKPNKWGSWGTLRHLDDENPRWDALVAFL